MKHRCLFCYENLKEEKDFHASCSESIFGDPSPPAMDYSLDQMDELAKKVVQRSIAVPGVQAKISMSLVREVTANSNSRLTVMDALGGLYIFKPPSEHFPEMPANEHLTMKIAESFGIRVVPSTLIRMASGELSYLTCRIDRTEKGDKIHMIDMFQATEAMDKYKSSMEKIGKAIGKYSENKLLDKLFYFELVVFAFLTGNNDMHLKNFSMIESDFGWGLSPAYDLLNVGVLNPDDDEELALTLCGKKKKLKIEHFENLATTLGLTSKQVRNTFLRMTQNKPKASKLIEKSFLSDNMKFAYKDLVDRKYRQLDLHE